MSNQNSVGVILLLLLGFAAAGSAATLPGTSNSEAGVSPVSSAARLPARPPVRPPHPAALAKDFHRMVGIMGKVDGLGQMALNPPNLQNPPNPANLPNLSNLQKAAAPESLINASALPDLSGIVNMLAPIMSSLGASQGE